MMPIPAGLRARDEGLTPGGPITCALGGTEPDLGGGPWGAPNRDGFPIAPGEARDRCASPSNLLPDRRPLH